MDMMNLTKKIERLSETLTSMQKCLDCAICYDTLSEPVRTTCGHLFCRECMLQMLNKTGRCSCPLCKANLTRRSFINDKYIEMCIAQMDKLVSAISKDTGFSELVHTTNSKQAKRGNSTMNESHTSVNYQQPGPSGIVMNNSTSKRAKLTDNQEKSKAKYSKSTRKSQRNAKHISGQVNNFFNTTSVPVNTETKVEAWLEDLNTAREGNNHSKDADFHKAPTCNLDDDQVLWISTDTEVEEAHSSETTVKNSTVNEENQKNVDNKPKTDNSEIHMPGNAEISENTTDSTAVIVNTAPLITAKKTWKCVKQFGKEMCTKKKKLSSLNVSIETTGHLKSANTLLQQRTSSLSRTKREAETSNIEVYTNPKKKDINTTVIDTTAALEMSEQVILNHTDHSPAKMLHRFSTVEKKVRDIEHLDENPANLSDTTNTDSEPHKTRDASFIMTASGEMLHIRSLNDFQMQDIIGVTHEQNVQGHQSPINSNGGNVTSPILKDKGCVQRNRHESDLHDVCDEDGFAQRAPSPLAKCGSTVSSIIPRISPIAQEKIDEIRETPSPKLQKVSSVRANDNHELSPIRNVNLSLKKNLSESDCKITSPVSRNSGCLSSVRRNLSAEILKIDSFQASNKIIRENERSKFCENSANVEHPKENVHDTRESRNILHTDPLKESTQDESLNNTLIKRTNQCNAPEMQSRDSPTTHCSVSFKKLGRVNKDRRARTKFFYVGCVTNERSLKVFCKIEKSQTHYQNLPSFEDDNFGIWIPEIVNTNIRSCSFADTHRTIGFNESRFSSKNISTESGIYDEPTTIVRKIEQETTERSKERPPVRKSFNSNCPESFDVIFLSLDQNNTNNKTPLPTDPAVNQSVTKHEISALKVATCKTMNVKVLSPTKDSQLRFLSFESPICDRPRSNKIAPISERKNVRETLRKANSVDSKTSSLAKGANSEALLRRSQESSKQTIEEKSVGSKVIEASESSESDSSEVAKKKKLKRTPGKENSKVLELNHRAKDLPLNTQPVSNESTASSSSSHIKCTHRPKPINNRIPSLSDEADLFSSNFNQSTDLMSLSKMSDIEKVKKYGKSEKLSEKVSQGKAKTSDLKRINEAPKKKYKRIVRAACSDSDSSDDFAQFESKNVSTSHPQHFSNKVQSNAVNKSKSSVLELAHSKSFSKVSQPWSAKRKRGSSDNSSSEDVDIDAIVEEWCKDLPTVHKLSKRSKVSKSPSPKDREKSRKSLDPFPKESSSMDFNCSQLEKTLSKGNVTNAEDEFPRQNRDIRDEVINSIIGRVHMMQNAKTDSVQDKSETTNQINISKSKDQVVEAKDIMEENSDDTFANVDTQVLANDLSRKIERPIERTFSELKTDEITLVESYGKLTGKETSGSVHESPGKTPPHNSSPTVRPPSHNSDKENEFELLRNKENSPNYTNSLRNNSRKSNELPLNITNDHVSSKDSSTLEQDFLMNVTQYAKMLRQLEEDFLGPIKPSVAAVKANEPVEKKLASPRTPNQKCRSLDRTRNECMNECVGEDDIVQSTPEVMMQKVFNSRTSSTKVGEIPSTPLAANDKNAEFSPVHEYLNTPQSLKNVKPLCQSTPNILDGKKSHDTLTNSTKLVFVCSQLTAIQIEGVKQLARICNGTYVSQFIADVTHVIVKVDANSGMERTLKCIQGIAHGKWIVGYEWVVQSLKMQHPVNEDPYEAIDNLTSEPSPRISRLREKGLFDEFVFLCRGPYRDVTVPQCKDVLRAAGATIAETSKELVSVKHRLKPIVLYSDNDHNIPIEWCRKNGLAPIIDSWVFDCIGRFKLLSFASYTIGLEPSELSGHFPQFLLIDEGMSDSDVTL